MKMHMFSVLDVKAEAYGTPFFVPHDVVATRAFVEETRNPQSQFSRYPADYHLYKLGVWDDQDGKLEPECNFVMSADQVVKGDKA